MTTAIGVSLKSAVRPRGTDYGDNAIVMDYFKELSHIPLLTSDEEHVLLKTYKCGNQDSRRRLIESNLRLVVAVAKKYMRCGVPLMDLIQDGNLGLIHALEKYDTSRENRFSTYAVWQIRHYIRRAIANKSRLIRIPVNLIEKRKRIEQITESMIRAEGREPSVEEISKLTNISKRKIKDIMQYFQPLLSLEIGIRHDQDMPGEYDVEYDFIVNSTSEQPEVKLYASFIQQQLTAALETLDDRESCIFKCYYGLEEMKAYTLKELGRIFNLTRERIRQIKNIATGKIKDYFEKNVLCEE
ncbi:MAG TPA: sigma-70 family RNA polymerase sigma factor [Candidatus Wallbacteria bacterium]|nr:sigma-70 family RNA polymerase sigma factor [Candidatus Wallbacteria bacterium]